MRRQKSKESHLALLIRAADAHSNWEVVADENRIPFAVRKKDKTEPSPDSPENSPNGSSRHSPRKQPTYSLARS